MSTTVLGDAHLRTLNGSRPPHHPNLVSAALNKSSPSQEIPAGDVRRNSDVPPRRYHSSLAWPSNHSAITPVHGSPHHPSRTVHRKPHKVAISKPMAFDSPRFSPTPGISRKGLYYPVQINHGSRRSGTTTSGLFKGNPDEATSQELSLSDKHTLGSNVLDVPSDEFDPRTMIECSPALDLDLGTSAASFGSVKQRTRKVDKALRVSRTTLFPIPQEKVKPDLLYTDDSDAFSSPPSTPSTPLWETTVALSIPKTDPKLVTKLELADVHAQIQAMLDSAHRPFSIESEDWLAQYQEPSNIQRNDIPPSLRPSNPMYRSFPRLTTTHKRSASSPPLGSGIHYDHPLDSKDSLSYRPVPPVIPHELVPPVFPSPNMKTMTPTSTIPADPMTPATPTKKPSSERSDSPSVYSQPSPSSQTCDVTPTSSVTSSPDHPYANSKHERLLAAISEGISSPTKLGPTTPSVLGSGRGRAGKASSANPPPSTEVTAVPMIVVTDPNDDDLVYSESSFSIVDMYTGSAESPEVGVRRRRTRTANPVSHVCPLGIDRVLIAPLHQPRHALDPPTLRNSVSFNSPRRSQVAWEHSSTPHEPPKRRVSVLRPGLPSSFLSMSTLHEAAEATSTARDRKSFNVAVGLKGLFRRSSSKGSLFGQAQAQANGTADVTGGGSGTRPGSTPSTVLSPEGGDDTSKGGWGLFKWKR